MSYCQILRPASKQEQVKYSFIATRENWLYDGRKLIEVVDMCDLDILLSTLYIFTYTLRDLVCKTHNGVTGVLQVLWSLNHRSAALSEALIHPILLSGSEIWGQNADNSTTVNVHLCTMKTILNVSSRTRNAMVYGESKCYHQLIF